MKHEALLSPDDLEFSLEPEVATSAYALSYRKLAASYGAEISAVDVLQLDMNELKEVLLAEKLLVIRDQNLDNRKLYEFAKNIGNPIKYPFSSGLDAFPEMVEIKKRPDQFTAMSTMWHSDTTYLLQPPDITVLYGVEIPPYGGNTAFSDTVVAFADLSYPMKEFLRRQRIVSRSDVHKGNERSAHLSNPENVIGMQAVHPAVIRNNSTGAEAIYVNEEHASHFESMSETESRPIIDFLVRHIAKDKYRLEVNWRPNTLLVSDNRSTQHRAIDNYFGHGRLLKRIVLSFSQD